MKKIVVSAAILFAALLGSCQKEKAGNTADGYGNAARTPVPAALQGSWMFGNFSMTEYWSQNPADYLGNALSFAFAFKFNSNGTFEQYFTSSSVQGGAVTYQQSVTKGTVEIDTLARQIITHDYSAHYKRTRNNQTVEERDMQQSELRSSTVYTYTTGDENGTAAIYMLLNGTTDPLTFLKRF